MFKLAVLAAVLAVATAAPGGLTGIIADHATGPITAPLVVSHAAALAPAAHVIAQPVAPIVRTAPIVTKSVLTAAPLPLLSAHGLH
ncbi:flagellar hook-length control protein-like [Bombus affinis]|uniref:Flagellar hook-length control protein n=1 Tax=Bombus terrestris TaxID=30195 RepID=A0A9B0C3B8_BOMTE|nr:flagellar hook-length control protein [Bombus terrestris]XP_043600923.1 flagellar hook-length control protein-like [Bombus pyrosoma]XP_050594279.1 flagellar hook-length control protein-like [Bombus affinis]XP_060825073.1 flagellar hook-length control protein-like [Bombus pascuorum]